MSIRSPLIALLLVIAPLAESAEQESPTLRVSLRECVEIALGRNLSLRIERFNVDIAETFIPEQRSVFDPIWTAGYEHQDLEVPNTNPFTGGTGLAGGSADPANDPVLIDLLNQGMTLSEFLDMFDFLGGFAPDGPVPITEYSEKRNRYETGLSKTFTWGTRYELSLNSDQHETSNPYEGLNPGTDTQFRLMITQPLLKGFGPDANLTALRLAENDRAISKADLRAQVLRVAYEVEQAYWILIFRHEQLLIQEESLQLAQDLLENNIARVKAEIMAPIQILSASAGVAARREGVIVAKNALVDAEDNLKRVLELRDGKELWDIHIVPADMPLYAPGAVDLEYSLTTANEHRPEFEQLDRTIDSAHLGVKLAQNQLRPQLDFSVGAWASGLGRNADKSFDLLNDGDFVSYTAALQMTYPLGNRAASARMRRAELRADQSCVALDNLHRAVDLEVRTAVRQIETNCQRVDATKVSVALAEERLKAEEEALQVGLSTSHDVLDFQEDLTIARGSHTQAVIDHILSRAHLDLVQGTLVETLGFTIEN
ncbi:MAG: TolC family protein [bacterium]